MGDATGRESVLQLLETASRDRQAAADLLPLLYEELRKLARSSLAKLPPGQTLQPTALVHEAYVRLIGDEDPGWNSKGHFFGAAAKAMRQILVERAREKMSRKRGGGRRRVGLTERSTNIDPPPEEVLGLDEALQRLEQADPRKAQIVMLRYFAGLSRELTAAVMNLSVRTVDREWKYLVARLHKELRGSAS